MKDILCKFFAKTVFILIISFGYANLLISKDSNQSGSGNWYEKLYWYKKGKFKYQELANAAKRIQKLKNELDTKESIINSTIHDLIDSLKIDNKQLMSKLNRYISEIDEKIEENHNEGIDDPQIFDQLTANKTKLEKLKQDFRLLDDLGSKVNEAIEDLLASQIERVENYEEQAMNELIDLENVLDDKKAKNYFEAIQNRAENISSIEDYIQGPLKGYLNQSSIRLNQLTHEIKNLVMELENQKIYLSDIPPIEEEEIIVEKPIKKPAKEEIRSSSILSKIGSFFYSIFSTIWEIITYPFKWLF